MSRKEIFTRIKNSAKIGGFTILDVIPEFPGTKPSEIEIHLRKAYVLGFITLNAQNPLCMYPTEKLMKLS